jgi:hypothetical protein
VNYSDFWRKYLEENGLPDRPVVLPDGSAWRFLRRTAALNPARPWQITDYDRLFLKSLRIVQE